MRTVLTTPKPKSLAQGLDQALIIYFYRRIFNLGLMLLQDVVRRTLDYLEPCVARLDDQDLTVYIYRSL
ncbi:hypothetical protein CEP54_012088 [Fusarium duplospermum]|uniref:Uncharacterized protein n=1 Tax=Fusarium duplospermum TaxID=1325734 RepID=A0A428PAS2_9HYPO|nr:hypothetical protein CEP54_012088 [Fusarium duplospermum]